MSRVVVAFCLLLASLTHASSFPTTSIPSTRVFQRSTHPSTVTSVNLLRVRGGSATIAPPRTTTSTTSTAVMSTSGGAKAADPAAKNKKVRISAFDSMRFFLILNIVLGHFISFAKPSPLVLKLFSQHNVLVGAFFALSGYVTAYTSSDNGSLVPDPKLTNTPKQKWILNKIFGYYPLHLMTLLLFSPIFLYADINYNGIPTTIFHGILSLTLTQAWFPMHAEVWNAPTWFLSALAFCTALFPYCLPSIITLDKTALAKTAWWVWIVYLLPKIGYLYDFNTWKIVEGVTAPKAHPNLAVFNNLRFSPLNAVAEVLLGVLACRIVMLDNDEKPHKTNALSTFVPLALMLGLMGLRANDTLVMSDMVMRGFLFIPLVLRFLMAMHRNTVKKISDPILSILNLPFLIFLGGLSFPIFIVHGPVGQIFFKKIIAKQIWGKVLMGPEAFAGFMAATVGLAWILQKTFLSSSAVKNWSKNSVEKLSKWF